MTDESTQASSTEEQNSVTLKEVTSAATEEWKRRVANMMIFWLGTTRGDLRHDFTYKTFSQNLSQDPRTRWYDLRDILSTSGERSANRIKLCFRDEVENYTSRTNIYSNGFWKYPGETGVKITERCPSNEVVNVMFRAAMEYIENNTARLITEGNLVRPFDDPSPAPLNPEFIERLIEVLQES